MMPSVLPNMGWYQLSALKEYTDYIGHRSYPLTLRGAKNSSNHRGIQSRHVWCGSIIYKFRTAKQCSSVVSILSQYKLWSLIPSKKDNGWCNSQYVFPTFHSQVQCILGYLNSSVPSCWEKYSDKWICLHKWSPLIKIHGSESRGQERTKRIAKNKTCNELCFLHEQKFSKYDVIATVSISRLASTFKPAL